MLTVRRLFAWCADRLVDWLVAGECDDRCTCEVCMLENRGVTW